MSSTDRMPIVFISHGAPSVALETGPYQDALAAFGQTLQPRAIVALSAHWEADLPIQITHRPTNPLIYDFSGFADALYDIHYDAPGSPTTAILVEDLLHRGGWETQRNSRRGLDHGVWVPLRLMFPRANIPIVQISLPSSLPAKSLYRLGESLSELPDHHILFLGSGGIVHNLSRIHFHDPAHAPDPWASRFDQWVWQQIQTAAHPALLSYTSQGEDADLSVPPYGIEHFVPLFAVLGASGSSRQPRSIYQGFSYGNLSMRCFEMI